MLGAVTLIAVGAVAINHYVVSPYVEARAAAVSDNTTLTKKVNDNRRLFRLKRDSQRQWSDMLKGGLRGNAYEAEQQMYQAVEDWADESGVSVATINPLERTARNDRIQTVRLRVTGSAATPALTKLLWAVESSNVPMRVEELSLRARKEGADNQEVTLIVSTIWIRPEDPKAVGNPAPAAAPRRAGEEEL
jgi:hypothetical protein